MQQAIKVVSFSFNVDSVLEVKDDGANLVVNMRSLDIVCDGELNVHES